MKDPVRVERLDEATLGGLESVLRVACGMVLAPSVRPSLGTALTRAAESQGMPTADFLQRVLARDTTAVEAFIGYAVIGETYFFRHPEQLRELARVAPSHPGSFLVWSAGCASGEEPYSIAMTLLAAGLPPESIRVVGTDVSGRALLRARQATYSPWSVRRMEPELEKRFLSITPESVSVPPELRARVEFRRHNLVTDPPPVSGAQAVFCRNVLIYFPPEVIPSVMERLVRALAPGGWLFVAPAELPFAKGLGLEEREVDGMPVLRKPVPGEKASTRASRSTPLRVLARTPTSPLRRVQTPSRAAPVSSAPAPEAPPPAPAVRAGKALTPPPTPPPSAGPSLPDTLERAVAAARAGQFDLAEELARVAARELSPEAYLLLAMVAEGREDVQGAVAAVRKALYLEPQLAIGHAMLVALYGRLGQPEESERARRNALRALEGLDDEHVLRGVEAMTAGGLRRALVPGVRMGKSGAR
ncbi:CheR family methyltransferase [Archangium lansingense]|uniref:CheR family methyltransferase n=1 Tax=Archangium lansingense TaxID=2995310 RepID=UPI003B7A4E05